MFYTPSQVELQRVRTLARGPVQRLTLLVLLKTSQNLGYSPALDQVPDFMCSPYGCS